jgi:hypothetical protein
MEPCPFARFGCELLVDDPAIHRMRCEYRSADCPFGCDAMLRFYEMQGHMIVCPNANVSSQAGQPNLVQCAVPGCGSYASHQQSTHDQAHLRQHMELLMELDSLAGREALMRDILRDALGMWPADLCVACKLAEGDTVACRECGRFLHEECDGDNNMDRLVCYVCKLHRPARAAGEEDEGDEEAHVGGIDLDGEHRDSSGEELEDEHNLTGFVVDDDHVSFSSGSDALAGVDEGDYGQENDEDEVQIVDSAKKHKKHKKKHKKHKKKAKKEAEEEPLPPQPLKKAKKENRRVIESPIEQPQSAPPSGSSRSQKIIDLVDSSSAPPTPDKKKKKTVKKPAKEEPVKKGKKRVILDEDEDEDEDDDFK